MVKQMIFFTIAILIASVGFSFAQSQKEPWSNSQLMQPADLAKILNDKKSPKPVVFSIGFDAIIKGSVEIGAVAKKANLDRLEKELAKLSPDADVVIYCGCCPFKNCPNIRPAFQLLNKMKFTKAKLLNLTDNIKVDWLDKGYPSVEKK